MPELRQCISTGMKTTLSVPDDVFESAERIARRMGVTRNDLYVAALRRYLRNLREMEVERILDRIGGAEKAMLAHFRARFQSP
jgi:metal-responsive CopG/Arc/MetJ family transcriptional regulator